MAGGLSLAEEPSVEAYAEDAEIDFEMDLGKVGPYTLLKKLGEGGFGQVFLAQQSSPVTRQVAVKRLRSSEVDRQVLARFEAERQTVALLDHPNIATIYDAGETEQGTPYFAMEFVDGEPLNTYCERCDLDVAARIQLVRQLCDGVHYAHQKGVIHRDLKPSNILVTELDGRPVPKIIDFGIAKAVDRSHLEHTLFTQAFQLVGTPSYMSPEQASFDSAAIDARSDIFALGILLYELLTGVPPVTHSSAEDADLSEVLRQICDAVPKRPSLVAPDLHIGRDLDWIVMKALEKEPERRYTSAAAMNDDLGRLLANRPVSAGPPSGLYVFQKFVRRHRAGVIAAVIALLMLVAGLIATATMFWRAEEARENEAVVRRDLSKTFAESDVRVARQLMERGQTADAVAYLCRSLRAWPEQPSAANTLVNLLKEPRPHPLVEAVQHPTREHSYVSHFGGSSDGEHLVAIMSERPGSQEEIVTWNLKKGTSNVARSGYNGPINALAVSPDGRFIITGSADKTLRIWDTEAGQSVTPDPIKFGSDEVVLLRISKDETMVAVGGSTGLMRVYLLATGEPVSPFIQDSARITAFDFRVDQQRIVTGNAEGICRLWEIESGSQMEQALMKMNGPVIAVETAPALPIGERVLLAGDQRSSSWMFMKVGDKEHQHVVMQAYSVPVVSLAAPWQGDGWLVGNTEGARANFGPRAFHRYESINLQDAPVSFVGFTRYGEHAVSLTERGTMEFWQCSTGLGERFPFEAGSTNANSKVNLPQGGKVLFHAPNFLAPGRLGYRGDIHIWNLPAYVPGRILDTLAHKETTLLDFDLKGAQGRRKTGMVEIALSGGRILGISRRGKPQLWADHSNRYTCELLSVDQQVRAFKPMVKKPGRALLVLQSGRVEEWSLDTCENLSVVAALPVVQKITYASVSENGRWIFYLTGKSGQISVLWDLETGGSVVFPKLPSPSEVIVTDETAICVSQEGQLLVWRLGEKQLLFPPAEIDAPGGVNCVSLSDDGQFIVIGTDGGLVQIWRRSDLKLHRQFLHKTSVYGVSFDSSSGRVAIGGQRKLHIIDLESGSLIAPPFILTAPCRRIKWAPGGQRLYLSTNDELIHVFDFPEPVESVPPWFLDFAETLVSRRIDADGDLVLVKAQPLSRIADTFAEPLAEDTPHSRLALSLLGVE